MSGEESAASGTGARTDPDSSGSESGGASSRFWRAVAVIALGALFAYDVWEAVSTLIVLPQFYDAIGLPASTVPWWLLIGQVAIPPVAFAGALLLGWRRTLPQLILLLVVALAVVAALSLGAVALEFALRPAVAGL